VLGLERDVYLSIVKFLDSSLLRKVWVNTFFFKFFLCVFCSTLTYIKNHTHEWNTFNSWFIDWKVLLVLFAIYFFFSIVLFINSYFYYLYLFRDRIHQTIEWCQNPTKNNHIHQIWILSCSIH
jgi:hypothetical protein